jgi:hypothetical protein
VKNTLKVKGLLKLLRDIWRAMRGHGMVIVVSWNNKQLDSNVEFGQFPVMGSRRYEVVEWHRWEDRDRQQLGHFHVKYHDPQMTVLESQPVPRHSEMN